MPGKPPPLDLSAEVTLFDGTTYRWDPGARLASDRPQGISFRTKKGEGFADAALNLSRRIDRDYVDINLLDGFVLSGADGSVAYEGRVGANPRSLTESGHMMSLQLQGYMAHAKDRQFVEVYVDSVFGSWGDWPFNRQALLAAVPIDFQSISAWSTDNGGMVCALPVQSLGGNAIHETWYITPPGVTVGKVMYVGNDTSMPAGWEAPQLHGSPDDSHDNENAGATFDGTLRSLTPANTARRYVFWRVYGNGAAAATPANGSSRRLSKVGVYGNHGLTTRTIDSTTPDGVYASDVITNIAQRFAPQLNTSGVQGTTYAIPHLAFKDPIAPYDAFLDVNKYHLWSLGVWENKTLTYKPYDLSDYDWEIRLSDPGVSVDLQGDSVGQLANGICVNYTDVATGTTGRITPTDDTTLLDTSVNNPANTHGLNLWTEVTLSAPTTAAAAAQIGRAILAEYNQPKGPGTITVKSGYLRDRAGHWQQGWKVRADQRIAITDHPNDRPRLIVETDWNQDQTTLTIGVDSTLQRVDAVLDRITTALQAANLS